MKLKLHSFIILSFCSIFCANSAYSSTNDTCFNGGMVTNALYTHSMCTFMYTDSTGLEWGKCSNYDMNLDATTCTNENVLQDIKEVGSINHFNFADNLIQGSTNFLECDATSGGNKDLRISSNPVGFSPSTPANWWTSEPSYCQNTINGCAFSYSNSSIKLSLLMQRS